MRLFTVRHATVYRYSEPVGLGEHRMMFRPRASHDLRLINASLSIVPQPVNLHWIHDVFDNSVAVATFDGATTELRFESVVTLEHIESINPEHRLEAGARTYPFIYSSDECANLAPGMERGYPTEDVRQWAARFLVRVRSDGHDVFASIDDGGDQRTIRVQASRRARRADPKRHTSTRPWDLP